MIECKYVSIFLSYTAEVIKNVLLSGVKDIDITELPNVFGKFSQGLLLMVYYKFKVKFGV